MTDELEPEKIADWIVAHDSIVKLGVGRAAHERDVCRWLVAAQRLAVPLHAGYASLSEYGERVLGLEPRECEERLRVGRLLGELPLLDDALATGELRWTAVRELTRIATRDTEAQWIRWARGRRVREVERAVAGRGLGDTPDDPADPARIRHTLRFEVRGETMALFRDLQAAVRADLGASGAVDDDMLLFEIARRALGGPADEGRSSYQVAVMRCDACGATAIDAGGEAHPVDGVVAEMMGCDSQDIGAVDPHVGAAEAGCPHVGAAEAAPPRPRKKATQEIPPATRRLVTRRHHGRCAVPGCYNHVYLDVHHVDLRSEGGGHDSDLLVLLCGAHHRAIHRGSLCVEGDAQRGFVFRHADGTRYGEPLRASAVAIAEQVFGALIAMGFEESRARALVDEAIRSGAPLRLAAFLRAALRTA